jgi:oxalate decarboxylase/phosphoglucose isomerase-like protein (cupin superfamily)
MNSNEREIQVGSDRIKFHVTSEESLEGLVAAEVEMPAGGGPPMMHRHAPAEVYRVERGELTFYLGNEDGRVERRVATAGEAVHIAENRPHTIRNESEWRASAFVVFTPGAAMEHFFRSAGKLAAAGPPRPEDVIAVAERNGIVFTGPVPEALGPKPR